MTSACLPRHRAVAYLCLVRCCRHELLPCTLGPSLTVEEALTLSSNFSFAAMFPEKTSEIALGYSGPISSYHTDFLFAYDIFPRFLMRAEAQWIRESRAIRVGDIIVQRAVLPSIGFGLCAEFAVRISPRSLASGASLASPMRPLLVI
jgi:hypothetical protein